MAEIIRQFYLSQVMELFETFPVVAILGARQSGKSTLALQFSSVFAGKIHRFDLENDRDLSRLQEAQLTLEALDGELIIIDEIQRRPNLFPSIRYLVDTKPQRYLILGSASRDLIQQSSESLAGRIAYIELPPFGLQEIDNDINQFFLRGGYPRSLLAPSNKASYRWRQEYIRTFLERDLAGIGSEIPPERMRRFWQMLAHYHGQIMNATELAASMGVSHKTIIRYVDILSGTFMTRKLHPWHENICKRQVKSSKIYVRDAGILGALLGLKNHDELLAHPKLGALWEGFAIEEIIKTIQPDDTYFWATSNQAELDLFLLKDGRRLGFEIKYSLSPKITKSMHIAYKDLHLDKLTVVIPKGEFYFLSEDIKAVGLQELIEFLSNKKSTN
ncbi:MAG: ATP-binding protein [Christensenellaceae bacterium]|jgi:predicted AAA+ superfamily ATPase|nr:ATP-binding protein [Christensenellaceae bacterium]